MSVTNPITQFAFFLPVGNTREYVVTLGLSDGTILLPSTCSEIWFTVMAKKNDPDPGILQKKKTTGGITTVLDNAGTVKIKIDPADTSTLGLTKDTLYVADVKVKESSGRETTVAEGTIFVHVVPTKAI